MTRIYLPPDANCLSSVADHCLRSSNYVNVIVADKQPHLQYLDRDAAVKHCTKGAGIWEWASSDQDSESDLVMASSGDIATMEALAATAMLRQHFPELRVRFVNIVDLFRTASPTTSSTHCLPPTSRLSSTSTPIHSLSTATIYRRTNHQFACARLHGTPQHQYTDGAGDPEPGGSLHLGDRCDRPCALTASTRSACTQAAAEPAIRLPSLRL